MQFVLAVLTSICLAGEVDPFSWQVIGAEARPASGGEILLALHVPDDHSVHADRIDVRVVDAGGLRTGPVVLPEVDADADEPETNLLVRTENPTRQRG